MSVAPEAPPEPGEAGVMVASVAIAGGVVGRVGSRASVTHFGDRAINGRASERSRCDGRALQIIDFDFERVGGLRQRVPLLVDNNNSATLNGFVRYASQQG